LSKSEPTTLSDKFSEALELAAEMHRDQYRKGTPIPYVSHLLAVAAIVLEHGGSENEAIAALLHDAIEDAGGDTARQRIRARFDDQVVRIVEGCTDAETIPKPPWRKRKEAYIAHLAQACPSVLLVSCADKLHNARSIQADYRVQGEALWRRFAGRRWGTLWYYRALADRFDTLACAPAELACEFRRTVVELEFEADSRRRTERLPKLNLDPR
jgi:(p)ppGpp synthase/HD superfamily hydrolase